MGRKLAAGGLFFQIAYGKPEILPRSSFYTQSPREIYANLTQGARGIVYSKNMKKAYSPLCLGLAVLSLLLWQNEAFAGWGDKTEKAASGAEREVRQMIEDAKDLESQGDTKVSEAQAKIASIRCKVQTTSTSTSTGTATNASTTPTNGSTGSGLSYSTSIVTNTNTQFGTAVDTNSTTCLNAEEENVKGEAAKLLLKEAVELYKQCAEKSKDAMEREKRGEEETEKAAKSEKTACWLFPIPLNFSCMKDVDAAKESGIKKLQVAYKDAGEQKEACEKKQADANSMAEAVATLESAGAAQTNMITSTNTNTGTIVNTGGGIDAPTNGTVTTTTTTTTTNTGTGTYGYTNTNTGSDNTVGGATSQQLSGGANGGSRFMAGGSGDKVDLTLNTNPASGASGGIEHNYCSPSDSRCLAAMSDQGSGATTAGEGGRSNVPMAINGLQFVDGQGVQLALFPLATIAYEGCAQDPANAGCQMRSMATAEVRRQRSLSSPGAQRR